MFVESGAIAYARQMRIILSLLLVFAVSCLSAETVYKSVDEEGNIIFTDKPSENAEKIILQELQTIKNPNPGKFKPLPRQSKEAPLYNTLIITSPADGSGIRKGEEANGGRRTGLREPLLFQVANYCWTKGVRVGHVHTLVV